MHGKVDGEWRADCERRISELMAQGMSCEGVAVRVFSDSFGAISEASLREAVASTRPAFGGPRCSCQPLRAAVLSLGILGSRAATPGPSEPMDAVRMLEARFSDVHCPSCQAESRVGSALVSPIDERCKDALVNGVVWVRELATERDWI